MKKKMVSYIRAMVLLMVMFGFFGCSTQKKGVSFAGKWKEINESMISNVKEDRILAVITDGQRFRIETENRIDIYDGTYLHQKSNYGGLQDSPSQSFQSRKIPDAQLSDSKFWKRASMGQSKPGDLIAGRETKFYSIKANRPDGEITIQLWFDSKTNIVLKSIETIYSKQVSMVVTEHTFECQEISYTDVEDKFFTVQ